MVKVHVNLVCPVSLCGGKVSLLPGLNEVKAADWKQVEKHRITQALIEARSIEVEKETAAQRRAREEAEAEAAAKAEADKKKAEGGGEG